MRLELGEISQKEFGEIEADILARLREIRDRRQGGGPATFSPEDYTVTGIEATFEGDEHAKVSENAPSSGLSAARAGWERRPAQRPSRSRPPGTAHAHLSSRRIRLRPSRCAETSPLLGRA